ncbi:MAG: rhodanese-like domain-containing protein [Bacteroidales bacterium]|jgi:rhodanese-related sulfurtransferase|nr:rhodanese-like domain-containing protein [Bacteroidales bacterium]
MKFQQNKKINVNMNDFFKNKGFVSSGILHVSPKEASELCQQGAIIVDVCEDYMGRFKMFDVEELIFCPKSILEDSYLDLPKNKPLIFADAVGLRSKEAVLFLKDQGFENIANMAGGMVEWERKLLPVKIDKSEHLTGSCMCMLRKNKRK